MSFKVLFKKRITDPEWYDVGSYATHDIAMVVAKGQYYYRGGMTPEYKVVKCTRRPERIPEYMYPILIQCVTFLTTEEQKAFKDQHLDYLRKIGEI
jgi:hypothetical protein